MLGSHSENLETVERPNNERRCVMDGCKTCLLEHSAAGDDVVSSLAVELSCAKERIKELKAVLRPFVIDIEVLDGLEDYWPVLMTYSAGVLRGAAEAMEART
jgi:hypothetical protein